MKGLELSKKYYHTYGEPMLKEQFADLMDKISVGLLGSGSECFGFDDDVSQDHDFEPGFCIFLPSEDIVDRKRAFALERAYSKLPKEFEGFKKEILSPVGGNRHGVLRLSDFLEEKLGCTDGKLAIADWFSIPDTYIAEVTNGEIFYDGSGEITKIREALSVMPQDVKLKKLAGNLLMMAQSGQYNYMRCIRHGEEGSAQLAVFEFVKHTINVMFLLSEAHQPFYKWTFKALKCLKEFGQYADVLSFLITTDNSKSMAETKYEIIEDISSKIIDCLQNEGITKAICGDLEKHAYSVNDFIKDSEIRNKNILFAI